MVLVVVGVGVVNVLIVVMFVVVLVLVVVGVVVMVVVAVASVIPPVGPGNTGTPGLTTILPPLGHPLSSCKCSKALA